MMLSVCLLPVSGFSVHEATNVSGDILPKVSLRVLYIVDVDCFVTVV